MYNEIKTKQFKLIFSDAYSELRDDFCCLDKFIALNRVQTYKNNSGDGTSVYRVEIKGRQFVVKRYNASTLKLKIKRLIFGNKAMTSWQNAKLLKNDKIKTVIPVATIQHYKYGLRAHAFFVSEYLEGVTAREYFAKDSSTKNNWSQAIEEINLLTQQLKSSRFVHDDYQCANVLMVNHQPYLIDLDHLRQYPTNSKAFLAEHQYDVQHFCRLLSYNQEVQGMFRERVVANSITLQNPG